MNNPEAPATSRQLWALFCATKEDHRDKGLNKQQASDLLEKLNKKSGFRNGKSKRSTSKPVVPKASNEAVALFDAACAAGVEAADAITPELMVVAEHVNPLNDNSPVKRAWKVPTGVCGFAWVNIRCKGKENTRFINQLKRQGIAGDQHGDALFVRDSYNGGYTYYIHHGNQSLELKMAYAGAFSGVLGEQGITAFANSRMD